MNERDEAVVLVASEMIWSRPKLDVAPQVAGGEASIIWLLQLKQMKYITIAFYSMRIILLTTTIATLPRSNAYILLLHSLTLFLCVKWYFTPIGDS